MINGRIMQISIFSQTGLKLHAFEVDSVAAAANFSHLLSMGHARIKDGKFDSLKSDPFDRSSRIIIF